MRKIILFLFICLLSTSAIRSQTTTVSDAAALKQALQLKLDEWHKAGSFPGATLGVVLGNGDPLGESFGLAVGFSDESLELGTLCFDLCLIDVASRNKNKAQSCKPKF